MKLISDRFPAGSVQRPRRQGAALLAVALLYAGLSPLYAGNGFVWTGANGQSTSTASNWTGNVAPTGGEDLIFSAPANPYVYFSGALTVNSLTFTGNPPDYPYYPAYYLSANYPYDPLTITSGINVAANAGGWVEFYSTLKLSLGASQIWTIDGNLQVYSPITSNGNTLTKAGTGSLYLYNTGNASTLTDGLVVQAGNLYVAGTGTAGSGALTIQSGARLGAYSSDSTLNNNVRLEDGAILSSYTDSYYYSPSSYTPSLTLAGTVTATATTTHVTLGPGAPLNLEGALEGASTGTAVVFNHDNASGPQGVVIHSGTTNASIASLTADGTALVMGSAGALPTTVNVKAINDGYVGLGFVPTDIQGTFLDRFDKANSTGTIGLDTDPSSGTINTFTGDLNLTGFNSTARLGTLTKAIVQGTITPQGTNYQFGGGGGYLQVESGLTDGTSARGLSLSSPNNQELTLILAGTNSYTGGTTIDNSLLKFASPSAIPSTGGIHIATQAYVGFDFDADLTALGPRFSVATGGQLMVGLDAPDGAGYRVVDQPVDLSTMPAATIFGTTSQMYLLANVTPAGGATAPWRFAAIQGGSLNIYAPLTGDRGLVIGFAETPSVNDNSGFNIQNTGDGVVTLAGDNTFTGGTTLQSGTLQIDGPSSVGTGSIKVTGEGNLTTNNSGFTLNNAIQLESPGILQLTDGGFTLAGTISGDGKLVINSNYYNNYASSKTMPLILSGNNTFTGGVDLYGAVEIGSNTALGANSSTLNITGGQLYSQGADRTLANPVMLSGGAAIYTADGALTFTGPVSLQQGGETYLYLMGNSPVTLAGSITDTGNPARLVVYGGGALVLSGDNSGSTAFSGGVRAGYGGVIFQNASALPANPVTNAFATDYSGYVGIAFVPSNLQADFINRFDPNNANGAIGFDTAPGVGTMNDFTGAIDLTGFTSNPYLGSASSARLSGTITPQSGSDYQFGGGGGFLEVASALTGSTGVMVDSSSSAPTTVRLTGTNTFSGSVYVNNSAAIFTANALPAEISLQASNSGYLGTEDPDYSYFISDISAYTSHAMIGFDTFASGSTYLIGSGQTLDLSHLGSGYDPHVLLGSSTSARIDGSIVLPTGQSIYRFGGYKGGHLTVGTTLTDGEGAMSVEIGDPASVATMNNPTNASAGWSTVTLDGTNTYSGGTTIYAGDLVVGNASALGSGAIAIQPTYFGSYSTYSLTSPSPGYLPSYDPHARLEAGAAGLTLGNDLQINADLNIGGANDLTLAGTLSGSSGIQKTDANNLTLSGDNSAFSGGIYIDQGNVTFASDTAAGTGALGLGGGAAASATFATAAPSVGAIYGDNSADTIKLGSGTNLTIDQTIDSKYLGTVQDNGGPGALTVINSAYDPNYSDTRTSLYLGGASTYSGGTTITSGVAVIAGNNTAFGTGSITLNGGKVATEQGVTVTNPLVLTKGKIGGSGTFNPASMPVIGGTSTTRVVLDPGFDGPSNLTFGSAGLNLAAGGAFNWELFDAGATSGAFDTVTVNGTVNITATSADPFHIVVNSMDFSGNSAEVANFDFTQSYSWLLLSGVDIVNFNEALFSIDFNSTFLNSLGEGHFFLSLDSSNASAAKLMLNFTPVPEPSTYALMALGLGLVAWTLWRRRRPAQ